MKTVLVVDNQPLILKFVKDLVEEKGHRAITAQSGLEALKILDQVTPELVFVDLVMPNIDGQKLCKLIKSRERLKESKIIVLSAIACEDSENIAALGADLCIAKGPMNVMRQHIEPILEDRVQWGEKKGALLGLDYISPRDITSELLSTKRHLEVILDHMSQGIIELNREGVVVFVNPSGCHMLGKGELELLGRRASEVIPEWDQAGLRPAFDGCLQERKVFSLPERLKMGTRRIRAEFIPLPSPAEGALMMLSDVTDVHRQNELLEAVLDGAPIAAAMIDTGHRVTVWNRAMEQLTGVSRQEVLGRYPDSTIFYPEAARPLLVDLVLDMDMEGMERWYGAGKISKHPLFPEAFEGSGDYFLGGTKKTLHFVAARLRDHEGNIIGAMEALEDVTEKEELSRHLQHAQKMQAVGTLAAGMAHEFNNILAAIQGYAQLLGFGLCPEDPNLEYLKEIEAGCQRAAGLIRKMLSFSRLEKAERLPLKVNQVVQGVAQMLRQTLSPKIELFLHLEPGLPFILGEYSQLEQVIMNLCLNSRDAIMDRGTIKIGTRLRTLDESFCKMRPWAKPGRFVEITVEDDGVGMPQDVLDRAFEPFFTTKEPGKGTGLGLTIAYSIVKSHQGFILLESPGPQGTGTKVTVLFPAIEEKGPESTEFLEESTLPRGKGQRILLVDDEPTLLNIGQRILTTNGYVVDTCPNGKEAISCYLEALKTETPYDLVILDVAMPLIDGKEVLEYLKKVHPQARILISTGHLLDETQRQQLDSMAMGVLLKPFRMGELLRTVKMALDGKRRLH